MKFGTNKEIIHYLHRYYYPFHLLSEARLKEAEELARFFKLKKNERIELGIEQKGDHFISSAEAFRQFFRALKKRLSMQMKSLENPFMFQKPPPRFALMCWKTVLFVISIMT
ncbi:MAG: hypothetical protein DRR08_04085 [Candidatus Parabeggiatoa sp. nov. 2]|nr:MAG: hypothetical protein DRR08_04085 [Gammaproteobacteria bacterium]